MAPVGSTPIVVAPLLRNCLQQGAVIAADIEHDLPGQAAGVFFDAVDQFLHAVEHILRHRGAVVVAVGKQGLFRNLVLLVRGPAPRTPRDDRGIGGHARAVADRNEIVAQRLLSQIEEVVQGLVAAHLAGAHDIGRRGHQFRFSLKLLAARFRETRSKDRLALSRRRCWLSGRRRRRCHVPPACRRARDLHNSPDTTWPSA